MTLVYILAENASFILVAIAAPWLLFGRFHPLLRALGVLLAAVGILTTYGLMVSETTDEKVEIAIILGLSFLLGLLGAWLVPRR
jgi:hypothetical protein